MKTYIVKYEIKANRTAWDEEREVVARNAKEACQIVKQQVKEETGRNAFRPTIVKDR